jgi:glycerol uptake facilitator-like aquaporin
MDKNLRRAYLIELLGTFALVYFSAGVVLVNWLTTPLGQNGTPLLPYQPGLVGVALAQGFILAALLTVTAPLTGGYLNPAVTLMLWVFNRIDSVRVSWLIGAQIFGAVLAGLCLRYTFEQSLLVSARVGAPHMNSPETLLAGAHLGTPHLRPEAYPELTAGALLAGTGVELVLTFFLVLAIFGCDTDGSRPRFSGLPAGLTMAACVLFGYALTGAAVNPARWAGTMLWELVLPRQGPSPLADMFVYLAGPVIGALLAGTIYFRLLLPAQEADRAAEAPAKPADGAKPAAPHVRSKK